MNTQISPQSPSAKQAATRRSVLTGLGGLGLVGLGSIPDRTSENPDSRNSDSPSSDETFISANELEAFVDEVMDERIGTVTPGATVAIVSGDSPILSKGYGYADVDADVPVTADETVFRVGSVGKLVTYTAVMQGVERGILDLDADINSYLSESTVRIPETYAEPVTLGHLGTHTAGFESTLDPDIAADPDGIDPLETVLEAQTRRRIRPPGELVGYSNYGAALAGHVVAEANETTFEEYVRSEIFEPLGMTHSTFAQPVPAAQAGHPAAPHAPSGDSFHVADEVYLNMRPAGSLSATATDMARFMRAHLGDGTVDDTRILDVETANTMHSRHHVRHPAVTNWRYGFHEYGHPDANLIAHSGATVNFKSHLLLAPDKGIGVFVAYNCNSKEPPSAVVDEIIERFDLQPDSTSPQPTDTAGSQRRAETVAGEYSLTYLPQRGPLHVVDTLEHLTVDSAAGAGRLVTNSLTGGSRRWVETEPYVYHEVDGRDVLAFEVTDGTVEILNMNSEPTGVYQPVPFHEQQHVSGGILGTTVAGFGLSLAGRAGLSGWRHWTQTRSDVDSDTEESE